MIRRVIEMFLGRHAETGDERSIKAKHLDELEVETERIGRRIRAIASEPYARVRAEALQAEQRFRR